MFGRIDSLLSGPIHFTFEHSTKNSQNLLEMLTMALLKLKLVTQIAINAVHLRRHQKPWYVPIAYFLTNNLNGDILKQLIYEAINLLT